MRARLKAEAARQEAEAARLKAEAARLKAEAARLEAKAARLDAEADAMERELAELPPLPEPTGLQRELAQWASLWSPLGAPADPIDQLARLVSAVPGVTADPADPTVQSAVRLERQLIAAHPGWVPPIVGRAFARLILAAGVAGEETAPIVRLASDPRMESVWRQLRRRRRGRGGQFFYPARTPRTGDETVDQLCAMTVLLTGALEFYRRGTPTMRLDEVELLREFLTLLRRIPAPRIIKWADGDIIFECPIDDDDKRHAALVLFADTSERGLEELWRGTDLLVGRHRTKPALQAFLIQLLRLTQALFSRPLPLCVGRIASVLFEQNITRFVVHRCAEPYAAEAAFHAYAASSVAADRFALGALPVVREIRSAGATSLREIADALNAHGIRTARGRRWHASTVRNLLARSEQRGP